MAGERIQRRIEKLLDLADAAANDAEWPQVAESARAVLAVAPDNRDAQSYLAMAEAAMATGNTNGRSVDADRNRYHYP